uniref:Uncharacterized protein n=1 Tax=Avena sativa TaxID=4498 RepID=A0ACD5XLN8_AVESA
MASSRGRWASPDRTVVWTEPPPKTISTSTRRHGAAPPTKVAVVYYLSRNGQLDHPHFMEVTLSSPQDGLCLRDVLDRLNVLRGAGMADAYSWSSKRSYRNGYVWHDLTADDPIHPANGNEYVLKGSELLVLPQLPMRPRDGSASSSSSTSSCQPNKNKLPAASGRAARRRNWSSFDLGEYRQERPRYAAERRLPRGRSDLSSSTGTATEGLSGSIGDAGLGIEREYFSGSLVETKKTATEDRAGVGGALKRSSSYNADRARDLNMMTSRGCKLELMDREVDGVRARCIPAARKPNSSNRRGNQQEQTALTE